MKVLMIAPQPFYSERGTPMNVRLLCQVLGEKGHSVDLLVFPAGQDISLKNVRIIRIPNIFRVSSIPIGPSFIKMAFDAVLIVFAFMLCVTRKYQVIHGIEEGGFLSVFLGELFQKRSVFDMDSCISDQLGYSNFITTSWMLKYISVLEKIALRHSSLIITVCSALSEKARAFAPEANIVQIEDIPILDRNEIASDVRVTEGLITKYDLFNARRVVYTGNLEPYQGIELLLYAWKYLLSMDNINGKYKLLIVGGIPEKIGNYKSKAQGLGIQDSVVWIGQRPLNEMTPWMHLSHVLVSPRSEGDNTPLKIYSYMNSGRPIVATNRKTHTQVLDDSMSFLTEPEPVQFAQAIFEALNNHEFAAKKAKTARREVSIKYSYEIFRDKLLKAYGSLSDEDPKNRI